MALNPLLQEFMDKGLIDDKILFFIGIKKVGFNNLMTPGGLITSNPMGRIQAVGLSNNVLRAFYITMSNHLSDLVFEYPINEIENFIIKKGFFGKTIVSISTKEVVFEYKVTANKQLSYKILEEIEQFKNIK